MIHCIVTNGSAWYTTAESPTALRHEIEAQNEIECWWYTPWGRKYTERFVFRPDDVDHIRTESDASAIEEL